MRSWLLVLMGSSILAGCVSASQTATGLENSAEASLAGKALPAGNVSLDLASWPTIAEPAATQNEAILDARVEDLISRMTVAEKVGQILQPEITNITPEEVREYHIGSVLNGGNGRPNNDVRAKPSEWLALADAYYEASMDTSDGGVAIPIIWGIDSVHGNNSVFGGTIFPHNIGLGAADDLQLMRDIGRVTAVETAAIGTDWTFAPAVSIPRDDRWGRTYEGFSEGPAIAGRLAAAYTEGLQGDPGSKDSFFEPGSIIATAKHFIADGGTRNGRDQGDAVISEEELRDMHYPPYVDALSAGAQTVMASYSKWNGTRMHGHGPLLTRLLKDHAGFDGFVVGDFNGHALIPGCTNANCPDALMAGVDMYMIPKDWKELYGNLLDQAQDGTIPMSRLDDAVRRILRVKMRAGMFEMGKPSSRPFAGAAHIATDEHKEVARRAARQSAVLLKEDGDILPFAASSNVLVAGQGANSVPMLVGGWSMNWQGTGLTNADFPGSVSVYEGIRQRVTAGGGSASFNVRGEYEAKPDVAVVVFGETPYAEYQGDRESVLYKLPAEDRDLKLMRKLQSEGIPVVGVFISGRPLWINPHLNASDAMVAAFLPGTQGGAGLADLLVSDPDGSLAHDFSGRLSFSWPMDASQTGLNEADGALFPVGYGLSNAAPRQLATLSEDPKLPPALLAAASNTAFFQDGRALAPWRVYLSDAAEARLKTEGDRFVTSTGGAVKFDSADRRRQEDSKLATWTGEGRGGVFVLGYADVDFAPRAEAGESIVLRASVEQAPQGKVEAAFGTVGKNARVDVTSLFANATPGELTSFSVPLSCFADANLNKVDMPLLLETAAPFALQITSLAIGPAEGAVADCGV